MPTFTGTEGVDTLRDTTGDDTIFALGGNDFIEGSGGFDVIFGGDGDDQLDVLFSSTQGFNADLGAGSDLVFVTTYVNSTFNLGAGNDFAQFRPSANVVDTVTLGSGRDQVITSFQAGGAQIFTDFDTGAGGDVLEFSTWYWRNAIWWDNLNTLAPSGLTNPFGAGRAQLIDSAAGALLQVRSLLSDPWTTIATFQGRIAAQFHPDNFRGWSPTGGAAVGATLNVVEMSAFPRDFTNLFRAPRDTYGDDVINGTAGGGYIGLTNGNDTVFAGAGNDFVVAGGVSSGRKTVYLGDGNDSTAIDGLRFARDTDGAQRSATSAIVYGGNGNDTIGAGEGDDELYGEAGDDNLFAFTGANIVSGGDGNDRIGGQGRLSGDAGNDDISGSSAADTIDGGADDDVLRGQGGSDMLTGGAGNDNIDGGAGRDTAVFAGLRIAYQISRAGGTVTVQHSGSDGIDTLTNTERLQFADGTLSVVPQQLVLRLANNTLISWDSSRGSAGFGALISLAPGASAAGVADFTGDGVSDILLNLGSGSLVRWNVALGGAGFAELNGFGGFQTLGIGDIRGTGAADVLAINAARQLRIFDVASNSSTALLTMAPGFSVVGVGNIDGVGKDDVLFRNDSSRALFALTDGGWRDLFVLGAGWEVAGIADVMNGTADDLVLFNTDTRTTIFWDPTQGGSGWRDFATIAPGWTFDGFHDFDGDGRTDVLLKSAGGDAIYWTGSGWGSLGNVLAGVQLLGAGEFF